MGNAEKYKILFRSYVLSVSVLNQKCILYIAFYLLLIGGYRRRTHVYYIRSGHYARKARTDPMRLEQKRTLFREFFFV